MIFLALGPLEYRRSGAPRKVGGPRQQRLLATFLVNANRTTTVDQLIAELWDSPPISARQQVHNAVANLRKTITDDEAKVGIATVETGYRLDAPDQVMDVRRFEDLVLRADEARGQADPSSAVRSLRAGLDLWRGEAFQGLSGPAVTMEATRLNELRIEAAEVMYELQLQQGAARSIVGDLQQLVLENPFRESLLAQLMVALARSGRQAEALAAYDRGRKILVGELGIDPSSRLVAVHAQILSGDIDEIRSANEFKNPGGPQTASSSAVEADSVAASAPRRTTCFLPRDISDFSGRTAEIAELLRYAQPDQATTLLISAIDGMGGVGKTTLAVRLGHHLSAEYPDGQYFLDLHGFNPTTAPITAEQALEVLLREIGTPAELIPPDLQARQSMWRAGISGKRAVLVLDNANNVDQVTSILPGGAGILVIVTSRRTLSVLLEGASSFSLDVFSVAESVTLFRRIAGVERTKDDIPSVEKAVTLCGRLPLAIRIAAARLRDRKSWNVDNLVDRLENQALRSSLLGTGNRSVMTALKVSYRYLGTAEQRLFRLLSLHPGVDFDCYAAAALAGVSPAGAEEMLECLLDDNLLRQDVPDRYYFHDLVRDCSAELCGEIDSDDAIAEARGALLDYYLHGARAWCRDLAGGEFRSNPLTGRPPVWIRQVRPGDGPVEVLRLEYANIRSAIRFGADNGWYRHAWQLAAVVQPYLRVRNYDRDSREIMELAVRASRADGDLLGESICLRSLAIIAKAHGTYEETRRFLDDSIRISRDIGDQAGQVTSLAILGDVYFDRDELSSAYESFRMADELTADDPQNETRSRIANNMGVVCRDMGRLSDSVEYFRRAIEVERAGRNLANFITLMLWNIGQATYLQTRPGDAAPIFLEVLDVSLANKFDQGMALACVGLANVSRMQGDLESSLYYGRRALDLARPSGFREIECEALGAVGETSTTQRDFDRALEVFQRLDEYSARYGLRRYAARAGEGRAHVAWMTGNHKDAKSLWSRALGLYSDEMVYRQYARVHLIDVRDHSIECLRCAVRPQEK
jgi:DNA-binding SARP family transcriptional activator/tetratricopeptide (TPR) repeat protein